MKVIACYSSKGGVGKTSSAVNLAYASAKEGKRTLLIDLDQQGASTFYFRVHPPKKKGSKSLMKAFFKKKESATDAIRESDFENLFLLPASQSYRNFDTLLDGMKASKGRLMSFVERAGHGYQRVILDCPPSLSLLAENVFRASDLVLVPVVPTTLSERTYHQLKEFFDKSGLRKKKLRPFFSMVEGRKRMHLNTMKRMREAEKRMLGTVIPYSAEVEAMGIHRAPVLKSSPSHAASGAFRRLWKEVDQI
ncbi:ParA family protein [Haloferula sp.]|uniref:ParA family protein n=1 Tax=Haloferula sp. TaxID=2497595 RepID=UPI00329BE5E2